MIEFAEAFISGLFQVFTWTTLSLMLLGILLGFVVGILPGLGGPTTLSLMLPFIFRMEAAEAFAFLLGMAAVTATTGDITSILFGIPGEPTTASTIVDGHPMAKKGEAGRALGAALMSSLVGAIFGAFALAVAIPVVRPLVLTFGSPEFFMLALLGVTFIASLSGENLLKGLIAGGIGLFLATIGRDPMTGIQRYTFGQLILWDGIGLVPVTIGLFAIPEVIDLAIHGSVAQRQVGKLGGVMEGVKDTFRHWWLVVRCSAIGAYIGIIPGMGGAVSQWVSYAHAVQSSPDRERFGKGAVEGVLGPGAANNSTLGGALVPTIAFGVPGSVTMAILLGAFIIQGLVPGPDMLIPEQRGGHLSLTFSFVWIVVVSNIITVSICLLFLNPLVKLTQIRATLLIPFILLLIYTGAFAEKNAFTDLIVVLLFGALGWVVVQLDWQRPPILLGLVLGPLMENRLFLSTDNYGLTWLWRPTVLFLFALIFAGILFPVLFPKFGERWTKGVGGIQPQTPKRPGHEGTVKGAEFPRFNWQALFGLFIVAALSLALWKSKDFGFRAGLFPWTIGFPLLILGTIQLVRDLRGMDRQAARSKTVEGDLELTPEAVLYRTVSAAGWMIGFFAAIWLLGFILASLVAPFLYLKVRGREGWPITIGLSIIAWGIIYGLFDQALHIPFPEGQLFLWLP